MEGDAQDKPMNIARDAYERTIAPHCNWVENNLAKAMLVSIPPRNVSHFELEIGQISEPL